MVKRSCPFDDFEPQKKFHVGTLQLNQNGHGDSNLFKMYEKTKNLLFGAVKNLKLKSTSESSQISSPNQNQPISTKENICTGCKSINFLNSNQCGFCDKSFCSNCVAPCCMCYQLYCRDCSIIRYEQSNDVIVCLSCT